MGAFFKHCIAQFQQMDTLKKLCLVVLSILAIVSVVQGFVNAQNHSQDFQWSPSVLLREGINPYVYYLDGNRDERIILSQAPNYLHALYVLLQPFAYLDWSSAKVVWALCNIVLAIVSVVLISRAVELNELELVAVMLIFFCSTPVRNSIGNGQQSLFALFAFTLLLIRDRRAIFGVGLGYLKYSFAPPLFFYILIKRGYLQLVASGVFVGVGFIAFYLMQVSKLSDLLVQPLKVSATTVGLGTADFMSIAEAFCNVKSGLGWAGVYYGLPLLISLIISVYVAKKASDALLELSVISVVALLSFKHLGYDFVFLLPALVFFWQNWKHIASKLGMLIIGYFWFASKALDVILNYRGYKFDPSMLVISNLFMLTIILVSLLISGGLVGKSSPNLARKI